MPLFAGAPKYADSPAVVVAAYRSDQEKCATDSLRKTMNKRHHTKIVREGQYVAEVGLELIDTDEGRLPCLSLEDAYKLGDVRAALRCGDLKTAARLGRVFALTPIAV